LITHDFEPCDVFRPNHQNYIVMMIFEVSRRKQPIPQFTPLFHDKVLGGNVQKKPPAKRKFAGGQKGSYPKKRKEFLKAEHCKMMLWRNIVLQYRPKIRENQEFLPTSTKILA
jgi:hypothetical protein